MKNHDSDFDQFDVLINTSIVQAEVTIKHLREKYERSLQKQKELENRIEELQCHKCTSQSLLTSKQIQCSPPFYNYRQTSCQTERYTPDSDDRFYQRVDDIVNQNKKLHSDIYKLQAQLETLDSSRKTMKSGFDLKFSEAIEHMKLLGDKKEKSFIDRINQLEAEQSNSFCSVATTNSADSGSFSDSRDNSFKNNHTGTNLLEDRNGDTMLKDGEQILKTVEATMEKLLSDTGNSTPSSSEFDKLRFEKESALKKCVKLDSQLTSVKKSKDLLKNKVSKLEEELQSLRLFYNLHQSLSQEASLRDQYDKQVSELSERLKQREAELLASQHENDALAAMVKRLEKQLAQTGSLPNGNSPRPAHASLRKSAGSRNLMSSSSTMSSFNL